MGPATAVLLVFGMLAVSSEVRGQRYAGESIHGGGVEEAFFMDTRMAIPNTGRGNKVHKHSRMPSLRVGLKVLLLAVVVPALLAVVLYAAWKGVTLALLSLIISTIIGLKNLFGHGHHGHNNKHHQDDITYTHNVIVAKNPAFQEHLWKRDMPVLAHAMEPYRVVPATGLSSTV